MRNYMLAMFGFCLVGLLSTCAQACPEQLSIETNKPVVRLEVPECVFAVIMPNQIYVKGAVGTLDIVTPTSHYEFAATQQGYKLTTLILQSGIRVPIDEQVSLLGLGGASIDVVSPVKFKLTMEAR